MSLFKNIFSSLRPELSGDAENRERERSLDGAIRFPVLTLIKSALVWLVIATVFGLIASIKLHSPGFFADCPILTYGKVEPLFWNTLVYGWLFNAGLACAIFLLTRLGGRSGFSATFLTISIVLWNTGVTLGIIGIMAGEQLPYAWLEFPPFVGPVLFIAFVGIGLSCLLTFHARVYRSSYASQWWILAALFSFAWIYSAAQVMLVHFPAQGAIQALINSWYAENVFGLFVAPLAFATLLYLIPKTLGSHVIGYKYSAHAFWSWIFFASISGVSDMAFGPIPVWVPSLGIMASFGLLLPTTTLSIQFLSSLFRKFSVIWSSATARFLFAGSILFLILMYYKIFGSLRGSLASTQFSLFDSGVDFLALFGFAGMVFTGAIQFILPRLLNKELPSSTIVDLQFWMQLIGVILVSIGLISGGALHGELLNESIANSLAITKTLSSGFFLTTLGMLFLFLSSVCGLFTYFMIILSSRVEAEQNTNLISEAPELEYTAP